MVREMMRRKCMLLLHMKRVDVLELLMLHVLRNMRMVGVEGMHLLTSMQATFRRWHGQWSAKTTHDEPRSVKVAGLTVEKCVRAAWSGCVVARHLICEHVEAVAVWVHHGWCQAGTAKIPCLMGSSSVRVCILHVVALKFERPTINRQLILCQCRMLYAIFTPSAQSPLMLDEVYVPLIQRHIQRICERMCGLRRGTMACR